ncbi:MAG: hypothetical protein OSB83_04520 [Planctomycetota bacterium]|nr:hypothetical protein [Planctomycetota bacterium]
MPESKTNSPTPLPVEALKLLRGFGRRHRLLAAARGAAAWTISVILFVLPALALDRFLLLETPARLTISWVVLVAVGAALALFVLLPLLRPGSLLRYAREIERRDPSLEGALLSLVEFSRPGPELENRCSRELLESLAADTARRCPQVKIDKLLPARAASRALLLAGVACILPLAATLLDPGGMLQLGRRLVNPSAELPRPTSVFLLVEVDRTVVGRGQEVSIQVSVDRGKPGELVLLSRESRSPGNGRWKSTDLLSSAGGEPGTLLHKIRALASFDFRVRGGDYLSPVEHVEVREPPAPRNFTITYHYPEYTARRKRTIEKKSGNISALKGSRAEILLEADRELARATILLGAQKLEGRIDGALAAFGEIAITEDAEYRLELETPDGITSAEKAAYSIRTLADTPPRIAILAPRHAELEVESSGSLKLRYRAEDDNGINSIALLLRTGLEIRVLPVFREISAAKRPELRDAIYAFSIGATGARPPETLGLKLRVRDGLGGEGHSGELKLKVTWPGNSPEGSGWLASLRNLRAGIAELRVLWGQAENTGADDRAAENVITIRSFSSELSSMCMETAGKPPLPGANRLALESAAFRLLSLAEVEAGALWNAAAGIAPGQAAGTPNAAEAWKSGEGTLAALAELLGSIVICEELEEAYESLQLAAHDCSLLLAELLNAGDGELPSRSAQRLAQTIGAVLSCSAGIERLRRDLPPSRSKLIAKLDGSVRAMTSSLTAELELARKAAEETLTGEFEAPLGRAAEAFSRRIDSLEELLLAARLENRESLRWQVPESEVARLVEAVKDAWLENSSRRELLSAARAIFSRIAWRNKSGRDFDYPDFESVSLLGAMTELLERILENDPASMSEADPAEAEARRARERKDGKVLVEGLARAARELEPTLWLGRSLQLLQWISAGEESVALRLKELQELQAVGRSLARRSQADLIEALDAVLLRLRSSSGPAERIEAEKLYPAVDKTSQAREAAGRALALLRVEPVDLPAAASEARSCASLLEEATGALEKLRQESLADIADTALWLRSNRGSLSERLARLAEGLDSHGRTLKASSTGSVIASEKGGELIVEALVSWSEEVRQAKRLARELLQDADQGADAGADPGKVGNLERASTALLEIVSGPLSRAGTSLRRALSTDRDDRELLLSAAAAAVFEAAAETWKLADALEILDSAELEKLSGEDIGTLVNEAGELARTGSVDLELIAMRARLLLEAALKGSRELSRRLGKLRSRADILAHLEAAAASFSAALERVMAEDPAGALARLGEGLARMEQAIALAKSARGEASKKLDRPTAAAVAETKAAERTELSRELESARRELEKLLELERLRKEASGLLDKLLEEKENTPEQLAEAETAQEELASAMEDRIPAANMLIELISRIAALQKLGSGTAENARYLEEEARLALAAGANPPTPEKLIEKEQKIEQDIDELVAGFSKAGFKLSMLLPAIFKAYRKAAAATGPLKESIRKAGQELSAGSTKAAVDSLGETNLQLGVFLTDLDRVRARAIETLAEAGERSAYSSLQSALKNARQAARLMSGGKIDDARKKNAAAKSQLLLAGRAIRRQLESVVLPTGEEGALVSRLLEAEAARLGLVWQTGTRGEEFEPSSEDSARGLEDMAFPPAYRDLVRIYLRAIRK